MKRSKGLTLTLMASAASLLSGCSQEPEKPAPVFTDLEDCSRTLSKAECSPAYERAQARVDRELEEHLMRLGRKKQEEALENNRFDDQRTCELIHGASQCHLSDNGMSWTPVALGVAAGLATNAVLNERWDRVYGDERRKRLLAERESDRLRDALRTQNRRLEDSYREMRRLEDLNRNYQHNSRYDDDDDFDVDIIHVSSGYNSGSSYKNNGVKTGGVKSGQNSWNKKEPKPIKVKTYQKKSGSVKAAVISKGGFGKSVSGKSGGWGG